MKHYKFLSIIFFTFLCLRLNSQIFVGGNIRINTSNSSATDSKSSSQDILLSPDFGKYLSDKLALGVSLNFSTRQYKRTGSQDDKFSAIGLSPFLRYDLFQMGKFSIYGQGNIGIDFRKEKPYSTTEETKSIRTYVSFYPGISYNLNNHILLRTSINFLSFGYDYITSINDSPKQKSSSFNLYASLDNLITLLPLSIGAIYKF